MAWDDFFTHVDFHYHGQDHLSMEVNKKFSWHLVRILNQIEKEAKLMVLAENSKYSKTGNLRDSIKSDGVSRVKGKRGMVTGTVSAGGAKAPYAKYVHEGTKRHIIKAKSTNPTGLLCFKWEGRTGRVSTTVRVLARNQSKNSYRGGSSVYNPGRDIQYPGRDTLQTTGLGGASLRGDGKRGPAVGYYKSRNGKNRGYIAGEPNADGYSRISEGDIQSGRGRRYQRSGVVSVRETYYRDEQRWAQGAIKDRLILTPRVRHPGYEGHPFLRNATRLVVKRYGWDVPFGQDRLRPSGFGPKPWGF